MRAPEKTIGILQPVYLPWLGYFEQLAYAGHFVFLDDVQYTHQDWRNRNRIKTANGSTWLTVPIRRRPHGTLLRDVEVNQEQPWRRRHLRSIEQSYRKCPHFEPLYSELAAELEAVPRRLVDLDVRLIRLLCGHLDIDTPTSYSSEVRRQGAGRQERLIEICRAQAATRFYEGARGADYIEVERFRRAGVEVIFQSYRHPTYSQPYGEFLSHQSAIDLIMNTGPEAPAILRSSPLPEPLRHDE